MPFHQHIYIADNNLVSFKMEKNYLTKNNSNLLYKATERKKTSTSCKVDLILNQGLP